jgi:hypothetical protein
MNLKNCLVLAASGFLLAVFSGCTSAPKINSEFDPAEDFTQLSTFFVLPFPREIPNVDPGTIMRITPAAQAATTASLVAKGYTEVDALDKADLVQISAENRSLQLRLRPNLRGRVALWWLPLRGVQRQHRKRG